MNDNEQIKTSIEPSIKNTVNDISEFLGLNYKTSNCIIS